MSDAFPPEPWRLRGELHSSVFVLPVADVAVDLPPGWRPVRLGRFGVVGTAWVSYRPGGVLAYDELMSTLLVRRGWRVLPSITHIWVNSPTSRDGGRELWGIPKQLATLAFAGRTFRAQDDDGPIATGASAPGVAAGAVRVFGGAAVDWPGEDHAGAGTRAGWARAGDVRCRSRWTAGVPGRAPGPYVVLGDRLPDDLRPAPEVEVR